MNETVTLSIQDRSVIGKTSKTELKNKGLLLGSICKKGTESVSILMKKDEFKKAIHSNGKKAVFKLVVDKGNTYTVMVQAIQYTPMLNEYLHIDFQQVSLSETVKSEIPVIFIGSDLLEAKKLLLNRQLETVSVSGFPQNIPESFSVDVSSLRAGNHITVGDIVFPENITSELPAETVIMTVGEQKTHGEPEVVVEAAATV